MFLLAYCYVGTEVIHSLADSTNAIFQFTSISRVYATTRDEIYLYYWLYALVSLPLFLATMFLAIWFSEISKGRFDTSAIFSRRTLTIGSGFVLVILFLCFGTVDTYTGHNFRQVFPPNLFGVFTYAFAFQGIAFFGFLPFVRICFALKILKLN
jgi:hypothetical protein